jgi:hypothetical protein
LIPQNWNRSHAGMDLDWTRQPEHELGWPIYVRTAA